MHIAAGVERLASLLLVAALVAMVARRLKLPYTVGLVLAGIALALFGTEPMPRLTKDMVFTAFLPPLIFEAALHMRWKALRRDLGVVGVLATLGVAISVACIVLAMHFAAGWSWQAALLFGVLISATDPVAVIASFKESKATGRFRMLLESESLFNDGTVAVLFGLALTSTGGEQAAAWQIGGRFVMIVVGAVACGVAVGLAMLLLAWRTSDHLVEITFTTIAAYGSFVLAEDLGLSGVLATMATGMVIGNLGPSGLISARGREAVESFWEYIAFAVNSIVFLLIGASLTQEDLLQGWLPVLVAIAAAMVGRAISVYGCCAIWRWSSWKVRARDQHILFWGGLRGALALALALGLPYDVPDRTAIVRTAFGVVAYSVIAQGMTIAPILRQTLSRGLQSEEIEHEEPSHQPAPEQ
jgi:CPA1 family monovalent cation:H+ antiporter